MLALVRFQPLLGFLLLLDATTFGYDASVNPFQPLLGFLHHLDLIMLLLLLRMILSFNPCRASSAF